MLTLRRVLTEHHSGTHHHDDDDSGGGGDDDDDDDDDDVNNNRINPALPQKYTTARNRIAWCLFSGNGVCTINKLWRHIAAFNHFNSISITAHKTRPYPAKVRAKICTRVRRPEIVQKQRTGRGSKIIVIIDVETTGGL